MIEPKNFKLNFVVKEGEHITGGNSNTEGRRVTYETFGTTSSSIS